MIPILYTEGESLFQTNGVGRLTDAISCTVTEVRNGTYELEMVYPLTGQHYSDLQIGYIIYSYHADSTDCQPFRIYRISRPLSGKVTVNARHISYDLTTIPIMPFSASGIQATFAAIPNNTAISCPFTFWTDRTTANTYTLSEPMSVRAMLGGVEGSILDVFGGADYEWDKWTVKLHAQRGSDNGVSIRYGKNLVDMTKATDADGTYNGVVPFYRDADGNLVMLPEVVVPFTGALTYTGTYTDENGNIYTNGTYEYNSVYSPTKVMVLDLSDKWESAPTTAQLRSAANTYITNNGKPSPTESVKVNFVALWQTAEYKNYAPLQRVAMGDTVHVYYEALGVDVSMRVVQTVYDVLSERYNSVELGTASYTLNSAVRSISNTAAAIASKAAATQASTAANAVVAAQTAAITGQNGGYFVIDYDNGIPVGWLIMDTPDKSTARSVIRANRAGIGFSQNGYNGPYTTAWTIDGVFNANYIQTGVLADANGKFSLDMTNGTLTMQDGTFTGGTVTVTGAGNNSTTMKTEVTGGDVSLFVDGTEMGSLTPDTHEFSPGTWVDGIAIRADGNFLAFDRYDIGTNSYVRCYVLNNGAYSDTTIHRFTGDVSVDGAVYAGSGGIASDDGAFIDGDLYVYSGSIYDDSKNVVAVEAGETINAITAQSIFAGMIYNSSKTVKFTVTLPREVTGLSVTVASFSGLYFRRYNGGAVYYGTTSIYNLSSAPSGVTVSAAVTGTNEVTVSFTGTNSFVTTSGGSTAITTFSPLGVYVSSLTLIFS